MLNLFKRKTKSKQHKKEHCVFSNNIHSFDYTLIRKPNMKNCYIRIKDAQVIVSANMRVSDSYLHNFIDSKSDWIISQLKLAKSIPNADLTNPNSTLPLLGKELQIKITTDRAIKKETLVIDEGCAHFKLKSTPTNIKLKALRDNLYKELSPQHITPLVERYSFAMQLYPTKITYRKTKSRWGSCSSQNTISLNTRLMMLPAPILDYIVIHELAHIQHKNHSAKFWNLVAQYDPDHKQHRKQLREYEKLF